jgi:type I restriction enzyme S subunit
MDYLVLEALVEKPISGEWGTGDGDINVIRSANFTNHGRINFDKIVARNIPDNKVKTKKLQEDDIIIEKSGGSPTQPVGRVVFFDQKGTYLCSNFTSILRPRKQYVAPKYLHYILFCNHKYGYVEKYQNKTTGIINLQLQEYLKNTKIPLPPLPEQQKIASILDAADNLRQKDQQLIEKYTALSQSLFLEMFGDPISNPMGWDKIELEEIADIVSGVTKGRKLKSKANLNIPYMRVANVQDGHLNLQEIKTIPGTEEDIEKFGLHKGDILLTEGGDPDKLGRGTVWNNEIENCIHQNHIFRVRLLCSKSTPIYLSKLCGSEYGKRYFLKLGKQTTGIASINKTQLRKFPVLRPPIDLQNQFAERILAIEAQKQLALASLEKSEALFNSLLQRAFKGELTT